MKPDERLLVLIGNIPEEMLDEALNVKKIYRSWKKRVLYGSLAAACMVVLFMRFVPAGQVMAAQIREQVERLLEELFPPKDIRLTVEGMEEKVPHEIYGELPKGAEEFTKETEAVLGESAGKAGFAIYVDMDSFETAEEEDCYIIRGKRIVYTRQDAIRDNATLLEGLPEEEAEQKIREIVEKTQEFYDNFHTGEIRITQRQEVSVEDAAGEMREELSEHYDDVSDIMVSELPKGLYLRADEGTAWDCEVKEVYFLDNGLGGVFVITASYIVDATEGTGVRFHSMIETFRVLQSSDSVQILTSEAEGNTTEAVKEKRIQIWRGNGQSANNFAENQSNIDYGIEVRTDINGDGNTDRVRVYDTVSGDYAFTQVSAILNDGSNFFIDYPDSWASSYLVTGDLSGNGKADIVVIRYYTGSTYNGCAVSVLHMGKNELREDDFEEYPSVFIQNPKFGTEQPVGFGEEDGFSCIGASIIEKNEKTMLRLISCVDPLNDIVQCVDCSYRADGWYIEDIQTVNDYWGNDKESKLLGARM